MICLSSTLTRRLALPAASRLDHAVESRDVGVEVDLPQVELHDLGHRRAERRVERPEADVAGGDVQVTGLRAELVGRGIDRVTGAATDAADPAARQRSYHE